MLHAVFSHILSLNPCSNGIDSLTMDCIAETCKGRSVLILVLMEYALGLSMLWVRTITLTSLNPCFNGIWSRRQSL